MSEELHLDSLSLVFESTARTDTGCVRELNEDAYVDRPLIGLWAVADGMGGHAAGEVASRLIAESLHEVDSLSSGFAFLDDVRESLMRVNRALVTYSAQASPGSVIGSTVVIILAYEAHYACLWAGDSRAYLLRDGEFKRLSRDHSMVQELVDSGNLTPDEARGHRRSNVITRAIGVEPDLLIDMTEGVIEEGDLFLLCSDGLTGMLEDAEIAEFMRKAPLDDAADAMLAETLRRGAKDNVTFVLVRAARSPEDTLRQA